ncbi:hypothetical protein CW751_02645 [Brumimicrobium salinarum]|uniref:PKD domain-containing protein n=1 Tax=Brumimicrobium salinarum TaxID=2058658 RepID=A0A2I0R6S3_9FLAO|nr:S8 family serine peptidase [Brumimicrobium salinarum]PKR82249.1 hypothetical protein CW751_02645 [Brumimicrobium salinarum]
MRAKLYSILFILFFGLQFLNAQNHHEHYQDGLVVFQLKLDAKRILSKNKIVDYKNYPIFTDFLSDFSIEEVKQLHPEIKDELLNRVYQIKLSQISDVDAVIKKLSTYPTIAYAELKELHHTTLTPNDTYFSSTNQYGLFKIQAEQAWNISTGSSNVVVAVTDNAIDVDHPDLTNIITGGYDAVDQDYDPRPCGSNVGQHGTHVSGTVGCETDNGLGLASIGFGIRVMPIKIGDCSGRLTGGYDGIVYAANNGADVINMSWGSAGSSNYGQNVINNAWNAGSILVAAAGNDDVSTQFYPAAYNNVVTVASTNDTDSKSWFSNYGNWIDIAAPGSDIFSTDEQGGYTSLSGTSMASPLVAGLLGLMKSYAPSATNTDLINCLYTSADDIYPQNPSYTGQLGNGRINAFAALNCLSSFNTQYDASIQSVSSPVGAICSPSFNPTIELTNVGSATLTGAVISYDWGGAVQTYNWSGSLATGQSETVVIPSVTLASGSYTFNVSVANPNGYTDENPSNDAQTTYFSIIGNGQEVTLNINTDCWGTETTWTITNGSNNVVANGGPYDDGVNGNSYSQTICLVDGCYSFNIFDDYGDGMLGGQYQSCNVNGSYEMLDENGLVLFERLPANADFGSSANEPFCVSNSISDDASISAIISPEGVICSNSFQPIVRLQNFGTNNLTSVTIVYQTSGGPQTYAWTGNLATNQYESVTLPAISASNGAQVLTVSTSNPNGNTDGNTNNDEFQKAINVQTTALNLPFVENFETDVIANGLWSVENQDNSLTWEIVNVGGTTPGNQAVKIDFFNYQQSDRRDALISPKIDLTNVTDADMSFEHAYRRYNQNAADSLIIYVSDDCGVTWSRVLSAAEDGSGSFATQSTNTAEFLPATSTDWCFAGSVGAPCFNIDLDAYVGNEIFVKFESYNAGPIGNNLYIDNINITGTAINNNPIADLTSNNQQVCEGETVNYTDQSTNNPTSWNWSFPGGSPSSSTSQNPVVTYASSGSYDVTLQVDNASGSDVITYTNHVTVNAEPTISIAATDQTICQGDNSNLSASGATSYSWDNGLGNGASKTVSPSTTTIYEVTGTSNGCSNTATIEIDVIPPLNINLSASQTEICVGSSVTLSASGATSYTWDNGLGTGNSHSVTPSSTTTYTVTGNDNGCEDNASVTIEVKDIPVLQITSTTSEICLGESTLLNATGADSYVWSPGSSLNNTSGATVTATPNANTTYSLMGSNNCGIANASIQITVNPLPTVPNITQVGDVLSVPLQANQSAQWLFNGNQVGTGSDLTITQSGSYVVIITDNNGCSNSATGTFSPKPSGLATEDINLDLKLYPNPTNGVVNVVWNGKSGVNEFRILNGLGQIIDRQKIINQKEFSFDLSPFETGVYMIQITTDNKVVNKRITKQ